MLIMEVIVQEGLFDAPTAVKKPRTVAKLQTAAEADAAEAQAHAQKMRRMATKMQANRLKAAQTKVTADDLLMAFHLANS